MTDEFAKEVDAKGLTCPEPVMMLHAAVRDVKPGEHVRVLATDPSTKRDIPNFCNFLNHELVGQKELDDVIVFVIKKGGK